MRKTVILFLGLALGLTAAEGILRLLEAGEARRTASFEGVNELQRVHAPHPVLGWALRPDSSARHRTPEFDVTYRTDDRGLRATGEKMPPGKRRIAIFGDSFAFGIGVADDATFAARLEEATEDEVLNFGVSGYDPGQYLLALEEKGLPFHPDAVIFAIYLGNDIEDLPLDHLFAQPDKRKPRFTLADGRLVLEQMRASGEGHASSSSAAPRDYRIKEGWWSGFADAALRLRTVRLAKGALKDPLYPLLERIGVVKSLADYDVHFALLEAVLEEAKTRASPAPLGALIIPSKNVASNYLERQFGARLEGALARIGIPYENMTAAVEADPSLYLPAEGHWNERGHERAAEALRGLLGRLTAISR